MKLPHSLIDKTEWTIVGPMGPTVRPDLLHNPLMGIDGGAKHGLHFDVWLGDGDSTVGQINADHYFRFPSVKDSSDLSLALNLLTESRHYKLHLWGFLGGRRDHEFFNIGETLSYLGHHPGSEAIFYNEEGKIIFQLFGRGEWKLHHQGVFSIGTHLKTSLTLVGKCDYTLQHETPLHSLSSFGLSNRAHGDLHLKNNGPLFIYYPETE